jgi:hypothetical protein
MKIRIPIRPAFLLLLAVAAASPAAAQQPGARARERAAAERAAADRARAGQRPMAQEAERHAFEALLRHREQLALSDQQVQRLQEIRTRLEEQNAPLRQRLVEEQAVRRAQLERMSPEERRAELRRLRQAGGAQRVPEALQPTVRQMRLNINEAMHQAQGVLTAEQRLRARELLAARARAMRPAARPGVRARPMRQLRRERALERRQEERERQRRP